jgi:hypothetical protein
VTGARPRLDGRNLVLAPQEPDQVVRLARFRQAHPDVIVGDGGFGTMQARIPQENGETVITRYTLRELLDKLDAMKGTGPPGARGETPGREPPGWG